MAMMMMILTRRLAVLLLLPTALSVGATPAAAFFAPPAVPTFGPSSAARITRSRQQQQQQQQKQLQYSRNRPPPQQNQLRETKSGSVEEDLQSKCVALDEAFGKVQSDVAKTCKVRIQPTTMMSIGGEGGGRPQLGLFATKKISKGETVLAMPYDDRYVFTADLARDVFFKGSMPETYDGWTGESGLIALLVLNEVALAAGEKGAEPPTKRDPALRDFMKAWASALPGPADLDHPLLWSEEDQEVLQSSSTNKIYRKLDDLEDDATWLEENIFSKDRDRFPEHVQRNGERVDCFNQNGFRWAIALVQSRSFFVDGCQRLIPFLDMCNHSDEGDEVQPGFMGTFGTTKGVQLVAGQSYQAGDEVTCSYGPKSAADYLLEHGFCPDGCWKTSVSEVTFEVDPDDRFHDDKLDILEFETYDQAPMDPVQSFDVVSAPGRDGEPDPAMVQFIRLCKLKGTDAFLLESIFRKEVWGFMSLPVSELNELDVVNAISETCQAALDELNDCPAGGPDVCSKLRESEKKALSRTIEYLQREREALDLKEYYQERRLKDLGLDSDWSPEDDLDADLGYGQTRAPGGADYDW